MRSDDSEEKGHGVKKVPGKSLMMELGVEKGGSGGELLEACRLYCDSVFHPKGFWKL